MNEPAGAKAPQNRIRSPRAYIETKRYTLEVKGQSAISRDGNVTHFDYMSRILVIHYICLTVFDSQLNVSHTS